MSAVIATASDGLQRTTGLIAASSNYTAMCWVRLNSFPTSPDYQTIFALTDLTYTGYAGIYSSVADRTKLSLQADTDGAHFTESTASAVLTAGKWYHLAYTRSGNTHSFYVNFTLIGTFTLNISALTWNILYGGNDLLSSTPDMDISYFREWNTALNVLEILNECISQTIVKTANEQTDTPLLTNLLDISGNSHNWTANGSVTFGTNPPIPNNYDAAHATVISVIPTTLTVAMKATDCDVVFTGWWKYTAVTNDTVIGFYALGDNTLYRPVTEVFSPNSTTVYLNLSDVRNLPIQFPATVGVDYYFKIHPFSQQTASNGDLSLSWDRKFLGDVSNGSIAINDDKAGFPLAILSAVNGDNYHILGYIQGIAAGEPGDILANGVVGLGDNVDVDKVFLYDALNSYALLNTLTPFSTGVINFSCIRTCKGTDHLWVANTSGSSRNARYIQNDASTMGAVHTLTGVANLAAIAAKNDESILYFAQTGVTAAIRQWDLNTDTIMADLIAGFTNYQVCDILVLSDDTIVVLYVRISTGSIIAKAFDSSGALLHTYDYGVNHRFPGGSFPRAAYALDDPNSFWVMRHMNPPVGNARFTNTKISDGSTLAEKDELEYEEGIYEDGTPGDIPTTQFGISNSCPFWLTPAINPPTGTLTVAKVTSPFDTTTLWEVTVFGLTPSPVTFLTDNGQLYLDVPVGDYMVVQTPVTGVDVTYMVSNQPLPANDNLNVHVSEGEDVTVMILDTRNPVGSGIYQLTGGQTRLPHDVITGPEGDRVDVPIPNPFWESGYMGDM